MCVFKKIVKTRKIAGYMYEFQDLTPISGHFRTNFKISGISGQRPDLQIQQQQTTSINEITAAADATTKLWEQLTLESRHLEAETKPIR